MLKILRARAAQGAKEERWVRKLAASRLDFSCTHGRAKPDGERVEAIGKRARW